MHTPKTLCIVIISPRQKVCNIKQLQGFELKEFPAASYLDKIKIGKNFYLSFLPKMEKWT